MMKFLYRIDRSSDFKFLAVEGFIIVVGSFLWYCFKEGNQPAFVNSTVNGLTSLMPILPSFTDSYKLLQEYPLTRSEERRVGKECLTQCRSRWSPYH